MARTQAVDADFAAFVAARRQALVRAAYLVCGDAHTAEDLVQTALVKLATRWERLRAERPEAYVRRIIYRDAISHWRHHRHEILVLTVPEQGGTGRDLDHDTELRLDVQRALAGLTAKQRAVLVLRYLEDRSEAETAELLGVSLGTVKSQTHAALARLRAHVPELSTGGAS